jgi:hypothetical protein
MVEDARDLLRIAYKERHARAVEVFMHYLPEDRRPAFKDDWLRHCYGSKESGEPISPHDEGGLYMGHDELLFLHFSNEWPEENGPNSRTRAVQSMERLLFYASDA